MQQALQVLFLSCQAAHAYQPHLHQHVLILAAHARAIAHFSDHEHRCYVVLLRARCMCFKEF